MRIYSTSPHNITEQSPLISDHTPHAKLIWLSLRIIKTTFKLIILKTHENVKDTHSEFWFRGENHAFIQLAAGYFVKKGFTGFLDFQVFIGLGKTMSHNLMGQTHKSFYIYIYIYIYREGWYPRWIRLITFMLNM